MLKAQDSSKAAVTDPRQCPEHLCYTRVDFTPGQGLSQGTQRALQAGALLCPSGAALEPLTGLLARREEIRWDF